MCSFGKLKITIMKKTILLFCLLLAGLTSAQQIQSPSEFLGYELGSQFSRHHQVMAYYQYLASVAPNNVVLKTYGYTNERRPLVTAFVSSQENIQNMEVIRQAHMESTQGKGNPDKAIVWLSYNVHGNESVSTEASMQTIYELLTLKKEYLENTLVIMDPCINPDGRDRYVNWYNENKNTPYQVDPNSAEHHEGWLSGRANHYMFDLNRDWAWLTQVESQQRLKVFNQWLPHVHVDFHEQGVDSPYYFAPAAEPYHEVITDFQRNFQTKIGRNHAKYFDANGWFYFTKERFDLLYPSYGDTYPTYNGGIGMTYEQGGSGRAGLGIQTSLGDTLTLKDRIAHHHTTGLSTVEVAASQIQELNQAFKAYFENKDFRYKSYVLQGKKGDLKSLAALLDQHEISYGLTVQKSVKGFHYGQGKESQMRVASDHMVVSTDQTKGTLVKVLFEPAAKLADSLTYDITAWSLPYAYGLETVASKTKISTDNALTFESVSNKETTAMAYVAPWETMNDARFLAALIKNNIRVRYSEKDFSVAGKSFKRGSLIIHKGDHKNMANFRTQLITLANQHQIELSSTQTGFVDSGADFGSSYVPMVTDKKIAVLKGGPTGSLDFGEIWHFFEQQLHYPISVIDADYFNRVDLSNYDVLVLPNGRYGSFADSSIDNKIKTFVRAGGKIIAMEGALSIFSKGGYDLKEKTTEEEDQPVLSIYERGEREAIKDYITGAIYKTSVDPTHPMAYGFGSEYFSLKLGANAYEPLSEGTVAQLASSKPVSGFAGSNTIEKMEDTLVFGVEQQGRGSVVYMVDNPLFRGFWEAGKLFFVNALFMVP